MNNQNSDSSQSAGASGTKVRSVTPQQSHTAGPALGNGASGESQGTSRGKQGTK